MSKKAKIYYFSLTDEMKKQEKLDWFAQTSFSKIDFERITPDKNANWINLTDNDFETLMPVCSKDKNENTIFRFSSLGVSTNRDEWTYDFSKENLAKKIQFFIEKYTELLEKNDYSWDTSIKWSRDLKKKFEQNRKIVFDQKFFKKSNYTPFTKQFWYAEKILNDMLTQNHYDIFGEKLDKENKLICFSGVASSKNFQTFCLNSIWSLDFLEKTQSLPLYYYEKGEKKENITDWALDEFRGHYQTEITA